MDFPGLVGPRFDPGSAWLVGAGPGDPGLLTLHAAYALGLAEVVVRDALVSDAILSLAPQVRCKMAGKRTGSVRTKRTGSVPTKWAGNVRTQQLRINGRPIHPARRGLCVGRLKGGDPDVAANSADPATLILAGPTIAPRPLPMGWQQIRPMTIATGHADHRVRTNG